MGRLLHHFLLHQRGQTLFLNGVVEKSLDDAVSDPFVQTIFAVIDLFD